MVHEATMREAGNLVESVAQKAAALLADV